MPQEQTLFLSSMWHLSYSQFLWNLWILWCLYTQLFKMIGTMTLDHLLEFVVFAQDLGCTEPAESAQFKQHAFRISSYCFHMDQLFFGMFVANDLYPQQDLYCKLIHNRRRSRRRRRISLIKSCAIHGSWKFCVCNVLILFHCRTRPWERSGRNCHLQRADVAERIAVPCRNVVWRRPQVPKTHGLPMKEIWPRIDGCVNVCVVLKKGIPATQAFTLITGFQNDAMMKDAPKAVKPSAMIRRHPSGRGACRKAWMITAPKNAWAAQSGSPTESSCNDNSSNHVLGSPRWIVSECM